MGLESDELGVNAPSMTRRPKAREAAAGSAAAPTLPVYRPGQPTVVVIDDLDSIHREMVRFVKMGRMGSAVDRRKSANSAWDFIQKNVEDIDLIITDNQLSSKSMSGLDLIKKVRGTKETKHIPIIMITVTNEIKFRAQVHHAGASAFFVKPVDRAMGPEIIAGLIRMSRELREVRNSERTLREALEASGVSVDAFRAEGKQHVLLSAAEYGQMRASILAMQALSGKLAALTAPRTD